MTNKIINEIYIGLIAGYLQLKRRFVFWKIGHQDIFKVRHGEKRVKKYNNDYNILEYTDKISYLLIGFTQGKKRDNIWERLWLRIFKYDKRYKVIDSMS